MDGDHRMKQHERLMAQSGNGGIDGRTTDFESPMHTRGNLTRMSQAPDRTQISFDYGYTASSFHGESLQPNDAQAYPADFARPQQAPFSQPIQMHSQQQQPSRRRVAQDVGSFVAYEPTSTMMYGFSHQGPGQGPFDVVPQYATRQSAAMGALSNHFAVRQVYPYPSEEPTGQNPIPGMSNYLNTQLSINQSGSMARPGTSQPFPTTMPDFTSIGAAATGRLGSTSAQQQPDPSQPHPSDSSSLDEAYTQYQRALRSTFDHTRAGRLVEASRSLKEISEWLVTNARDLGRFSLFHLLSVSSSHPSEF